MDERMKAFAPMVLVGLLAAGAGAAETTWTFQQIDPSPMGYNSLLAMSMRTGATWPTVFYDGSYGSPPLNDQLVASSLTPVGWIPMGLGQYGPGSSYMRSQAGHDGRVGVTWQANNAIHFGQASNLGWQMSTVGGQAPGYAESAPSLAYLSGDRPVVAYTDQQDQILVNVFNGMFWETDTVYFENGQASPWGTHTTVAADSLDRVGVAYVDQSSGDISFALNDPTNGTWSGVPVTQGFGGAESLSLAFGPNDEVGLAIRTYDDSLDFASFDTMQGEWVVEPIANGVWSERVNLVYDSEGHPAVAYVDQNEVLHYLTNEGLGWADITLPTGYDPDSGLYVSPYGSSDAALAFDYRDLPVVSYYSQNGLLLAYDPTVVPEPSSLLLVLGGLALVRRRRK